jgi:hypothetical protein
MIENQPKDKTPKEPRKAKPKNNKDFLVKFRVDEKELKQLKEAAMSYKSVSEFTRFSCLKPEKKSKLSSKELEKKLEKLIQEVNAIGKNINQAARYVNFLESGDIKHVPSIDRFNREISNYTALQIRIEGYLKQLLKS